MPVFARAAVVALLALAVSAPLPASAQEDVPWTVSTAANDFGADRENYRYTVEPGDLLDDALVVANRGAQPLDLAVYSADGFTTKTGQLDLVTKDTPSTGVGAWVRPAVDHVTVAPGQSTEVPFTVAVPESASSGDHAGGIVTSLTQGGVERRVGIRVQLRVGGGLAPALAVEDLAVHYSGSAFGEGDATLTYTIRNTGNAIVAARQTASVSGPFGAWRTDAAPIGDSPQLLPGETWPVSVPVSGVVPSVLVTGSVTLVPLLTDAAGSITPLESVETTAEGWAVPWLLLVLVVVIGAGLILWRLVPAAGKRRQREAHAAA
ncbi:MULTISPECIES: WxL protein peptidoglycan domain-containing protein [Amycolatopsis]|uniref:DUF916 domain-containing protein n=2 Tax=Amycolatopsis TaxID=1813 RepID=A0A1I3QDR9_9PSEU|nr:DUF916 domain-containing protein [Amycolatopsis sacchari]SFJ31501.1 protein of unknown function [Amycolatopsis sacchari]